MHVLPLPFGMALAVLPRRDAERLGNTEPSTPPALRSPLVREQIRTENRYAEFRQQFV
jgi:hypothetical protein